MRGLVLVVLVVIAGEAAAAPPYSFTPPPGWSDASARAEPMFAERRANARADQALYDGKAFGDEGEQLVTIEDIVFQKFAVSIEQLERLETSARDAAKTTATIREYALTKGPRLWKSIQRATVDNAPVTIWRHLGFVGRSTHVIVAACYAADATCDRVLAGLSIPEAVFRNLANLGPISDDDDGPPTWLPWGTGATSLVLAGLFAAYAREKRKRQAS